MLRMSETTPLISHPVRNISSWCTRGQHFRCLRSHLDPVNNKNYPYSLCDIPRTMDRTDKLRVWKKKERRCLLDRNLSATPGSSVRCTSVRTGCGRNEAARDTHWISIRDQQCLRSSVLNFILILSTINPAPMSDNEKVHQSLPNTENCIFFRPFSQLLSFKDYA